MEVTLNVSTACFAFLSQDQWGGPMFYPGSWFFFENFLDCPKNVPEALRRYSAKSTFGLVSTFLEPILPKVCTYMYIYEGHLIKWIKLIQNLSLKYLQSADWWLIYLYHAFNTIQCKASTWRSVVAPLGQPDSDLPSVMVLPRLNSGVPIHDSWIWWTVTNNSSWILLGECKYFITPLFSDFSISLITYHLSAA